MLISGYSIEPIDLERSAELCVAFRRDSYVCSFGDEARFVQESGPGGAGYLDWLRRRVAEFPAGHVHVWRGREIVGQMEMQVRDASAFLYVNLFYLVPAERGTGAGAVLHRYAVHLCRAQGVTLARLSVSPSNQRALAYYRKHGWQDLGQNPEQLDVHEMELDVGAVHPRLGCTAISPLSDPTGSSAQAQGQGVVEVELCVNESAPDAPGLSERAGFSCLGVLRLS